MGGKAFGFEAKRMDKSEYEDTLALNLARIDSSQHYNGMGRGVALFIPQDVYNSNSDNTIQTQFAGKVLTHEQALEIRDLLNKQYPDN